MSEQAEIMYLGVEVTGGRGTIGNAAGEQAEAYFFVAMDPDTGKKHVFPLDEQAKEKVLRGWSKIEAVGGLVTPGG